MDKAALDNWEEERQKSMLPVTADHGRSHHDTLSGVRAGNWEVNE